MIDKIEKGALFKTLELAGVKNPVPKKLKVLEFSKAKKDENRKVREAANFLIHDLLETNDLGTCIHVTGEMRALTDPFHRQICEEMKRRDKGSFHVLFNIPPERRQNAAALVAWNLSKWAEFRSRQWKEELRTIDVIANRSVNLLAYETLQDIQFSVFGHKYILLQEKHNDEVASKRIWLLESEAINGLLVERGRQFISGAVNIDEGLFREFAINLSGLVARWYLSKLEKKSIEKDNLLSDSFIRDFAQNPQGSLDALKIMGFIVESKYGLLNITSTGREFLSAY
ncbi:MAG: hypothetical protein HZB67_05160 [Candidatus Aenigmarchaeota archaeon]|nr:hypothetical protein [Candidatus Aenigmarchaeota archaeon]MBI5203918.1 hypothetical protein [Nitrospirota bacterium]